MLSTSLTKTIEKYWFFREEEHLFIDYDPADQFLSMFQPKAWWEVWIALRVFVAILLILWVIDFFNLWP